MSGHYSLACGFSILSPILYPFSELTLKLMLETEQAKEVKDRFYGLSFLGTDIVVRNFW